MRILFLSTWFPFPPNQGSKIRAFHLLDALARKHSVGLLSFQDGELAIDWRQAIEQRCAFVEVIPREPFAQDRNRSITGWFSAQPRAVFAGYSPEFSTRARELSDRWKPDCIVALTFITAPYALQIDGIPRVLDIDVLLGRMLREEFDQESGLLSRLRRYVAYRKFDRYERRLFPRFDLCLLTSEDDNQLALDRMGLSRRQARVVPNGVDVSYFRPGLYPEDASTLIFHGALTYFANYDAAEYFLESIFPIILNQMPDVNFTITGSTKEVALESLKLNNQVRLTGYVEDIREILGRSSVCVVPLRKGAGTRIKILEAMAMGIPVVSTSKGAEGLGLRSGVHALIADDPIEFAHHTLKLLTDESLRDDLIGNASHLVSEQYAWSEIGERFEAMVSSLAEVD